MPLASVLKVMIADDQQTSRLLIRSALSDIGITNVAMAKDGEEALGMVMKSPVHLVISDYHMPKLNGVELLRAVRSHGPTQKSAFFLLTGVEDKEFLQLAMSLKVNNYLKKPVSVPELKKKIEAVFGVLQ
ncbi:response regulator transcription factor [Lichenibacterium ramalinae]|uniref:Response regulator n=1 Tax=Lichenibacterium ramalinae TaxID=2316527 RepID=A0A4Q2R8C5_9HYPH|nr:response regulator [Lichenibacterium ramalinae]RYB03070.1 response regulator [Lichenibacterium ramalinae]